MDAWVTFTFTEGGKCLVRGVKSTKEARAIVQRKFDLDLSLDDQFEPFGFPYECLNRDIQIECTEVVTSDQGGEEPLK